MIGLIIGIIIGVAVGWYAPKPQWADTIKEKVLGFINR